MIFTPQITLTNEVCDSMKVPRGTEIKTEITLSRDVLEQNMLITIPDDLCDFVKVPSGTKMTRTEIESFGKKFIKENHIIGASWKTLIYNEDDDVVNISKLLHLSALVKSEVYPLPNELCNLLEIPCGVLMNRFDVENQMSEYIRVNKMMRGQTINFRCDEHFREFFAIPKDIEEISYSDLMMKIIAYFVEKVQFANTMKGIAFRNILIKISGDELADFLEVPKSTKMSTAEAVCRVAKYTFDNRLQVWDCKKNSFTPDKKLRKLFSLPEDDGKRMEITYEDLQARVMQNM
jgi:hypothetical protein